MAKTRTSGRLDFRVSVANRRLIERAAAIRGQPLTAFAVGALLSAAEDVITSAERRELTDRDRKVFLKALDEERPNARLLAAAKRYRSRSQTR